MFNGRRFELNRSGSVLAIVCLRQNLLTCQKFILFGCIKNKLSKHSDGSQLTFVVVIIVVVVAFVVHLCRRVKRKYLYLVRVDWLDQVIFVIDCFFKHRLCVQSTTLGHCPETVEVTLVKEQKKRHRRPEQPFAVVRQFVCQSVSVSARMRIVRIYIQMLQINLSFGPRPLWSITERKKASERTQITQEIPP